MQTAKFVSRRTFLSNARTVALLYFALLCFVLQSASGQLPATSLDKFDVDHPSYSTRRAFRFELRGAMFDYVREKGNPLLIVNYSTLVSYPTHGTLYFPQLRDGELVPLLGRLYRYKPGGTFTRVEEDELYTAILPRPDSLTIPLQRQKSGYGIIEGPPNTRHLAGPIGRRGSYNTHNGGRTRIAVESIDNTRSFKSPHTVRIVIERSFQFTGSRRGRRTSTIKKSIKKTIVLRIGDRIEIGIDRSGLEKMGVIGRLPEVGEDWIFLSPSDFKTVRHETWVVRNIVPRDDKKKILGWVEIGPKRRMKRPAVIVAGSGTVTLKVAGKAADKPSATKPIRRAWISTTFKGKDGKLWLAGLWTSDPRIREFRNPDEQPAHYRFNFPPLATGDVVPLWDDIYRLKSLEPGAVVFERIADKELPPGVDRRAGALYIPNRRARGGHERLYSRGLASHYNWIDVFHSGFSERKSKSGKRIVYALAGSFSRYNYGAGEPALYPVAVIEDPTQRRMTPPFQPRTLFKGAEFHIVHVVSPDEKRQVIGWMQVIPGKK